MTNPADDDILAQAADAVEEKVYQERLDYVRKVRADLASSYAEMAGSLFGMLRAKGLDKDLSKALTQTFMQQCMMMPVLMQTPGNGE